MSSTSASSGDGGWYDSGDDGEQLWSGLCNSHASGDASSQDGSVSYTSGWAHHIDDDDDNHLASSLENLRIGATKSASPKPGVFDPLARGASKRSPPQGELGPIAAMILMAFLYTARAARFDVTFGIQLLARRITRWDFRCD